MYVEFYSHRYLKNDGKQYYFRILLDLEKRVQFLLFVDCSNENLMSLTFLERYSIFNKAVPGLKLRYGGKQREEVIPLCYSGKDEHSINDIVTCISGSF